MVLFHALKFVIGTFFLSTASSFAICSICKEPFINPTFNKDKIINQTKSMVSSLTLVLGESVLFYTYIYGSLSPYGSHSAFYTVFNCLLYSLFIEFNYYIYHYTVHTKYLYQLIHKIHHKNVIVYPFDTYYFNYIDNIGATICLQIPPLFIPMTELELFIVTYIYIVGSFLSHSKNWVHHHYLHHKYLYCNYCLLNPVFDLLLGTYR